MPSFLTRLTSFRSSNKPTNLRRGASFSVKKSNSKRNSLALPKSKSETQPSAPPTPINGSNQNLPDITINNIKPKISESNNTKDLEKETYVNDIGESLCFWEIGNYKKTLERCDNGHKLAIELTEMISERAKIEEAYSKSLKSFHKKWTEHLRSKACKEYETGKDSWQAFLNTANKTADIHFDMSKKLGNNPVVKIKDWDKKNYEKKMFSFKVTNEFERDFNNAEKSWRDYVDKLNKSKDNYYKSIEQAESKEEKSASSQNDTRLSQEQKDKINEKALKSREEEKKARESYAQTLMEIDLYKPQHIKKMTEVFKRTQDFEQQRMIFFKQIFLECNNLIQIHKDEYERFEEIFAEYVDKVNKSNPINDLEWWSRHFGVDTQPNWPQFEEYE